MFTLEKRLQLQALLEELLGSDNVYFQAPSDVQMSYPAIVYERSKIDSEYANNRPFSQTTRYTLVVMDWDPDSDIVRRIAALPMCAHDRHYTVEQLNHDAFTLYY